MIQHKNLRLIWTWLAMKKTDVDRLVRAFQAGRKILRVLQQNPAATEPTENQHDKVLSAIHDAGQEASQKLEALKTTHEIGMRSSAEAIKQINERLDMHLNCLHQLIDLISLVLEPNMQDT